MPFPGTMSAGRQSFAASVFSLLLYSHLRFLQLQDFPPAAHRSDTYITSASILFCMLFVFCIFKLFLFLSVTAVEQILPAAVDFLLEKSNQVLISGLEEVLEAPLGTEEVLNGEFVFGPVAQNPLAVVDFEEWPVAGLHCQTTDFHDLAGLVAPAAGAGGHHVEKGGALGINGFGSLSVQVFEVFCQGCLGCVRHVVLSDDGGEIFAVLDLSAGAFAGRCRRCVREHGMAEERWIPVFM